ncbi:MAG: hypothetical protein LBE76_02240 [Nitrososphaerota archaeon]|nr:hypothetical protein [Nitrososphaerota archaeon]
MILIWYGLKIINDVKKRLIKIAESYGRFDILKLYFTDVGLFGSNREKLNRQAFNALVDYHNERIKYL